MATETQYRFFKEMYDEENKRYSDLDNKKQVEIASKPHEAKDDDSSRQSKVDDEKRSSEQVDYGKKMRQMLAERKKGLTSRSDS